MLNIIDSKRCPTMNIYTHIILSIFFIMYLHARGSDAVIEDITVNTNIMMTLIPM